MVREIVREIVRCIVHPIDVLECLEGASDGTKALSLTSDVKLHCLIISDQMNGFTDAQLIGLTNTMEL